ncbi:MAG: TIGR03960 family B12-binding radical SAM protein [Candidatus Omnitrophica bacterium]|nr:TIGR03960 family B12-binding radical SAM protein [Candidatus Omnitrophota bacterium]
MISEEILLKFKSPVQYLGNELNVLKKDFSKVYIRFALCFPDVYEVGMSNLGLRIIYGLLNSIEDVVCERVFLPQSDLQEFLFREKKKIFSWESKRDLNDFDILGFCLSYELNYTGILKILELADIPFFFKERGEGYPLVIGGGFCTLNPEPLADFFDLFIIGEAEEVILEFIDIYRNLKKKNQDRRPLKREFLHHLKYLEGVYIPSFYNVTYNKDGTIKKFFATTQDAPLLIKRRSLKKIESSFYPSFWIVPFTEIVHDRMTLEIMRGCPHSCRFCQARVFYYPLRFRSIEKILALSRDIFNKTGYEELSLGGLCVSDYPQIKILVEKLNSEFRDRKLILSFSSLRERTAVEEIISFFDIIKKGGLTFAPETGSDKLRKIINKEFNRDIFLSIVEKAYQKGFRHLKLYFMIGLPGEEKEDLDSIIDFVDSIYYFIKTKYNKNIGINVSINTFIPKPHTPFQWVGMEKLEEISRKQSYIFSKMKSRRWLKINFHNLYMSFLECLLSRLDRRASQIIYNAYRKGACFDAWSGYFNLNIWQEAWKEVDINPEFYVYRLLNKEEVLPWDFIEVGISKDALWRDFKQAEVDL